MSTLRPSDIIPGADLSTGRPVHEPAPVEGPATPSRDQQARSFIWRRRVRTLRRGGLVIAVAAGLAGGWWGWRSGEAARLIATIDSVLPDMNDLPGMTVKQVEVSGTYHLTPDDVIAAASLDDGQKIADVNLNAVRDAVEDLGWVKTARVARLLPDTIRIDVVERTPFALWQYDGILRLIDAEGAEMTRDALGRFATLPLVVGEGAPEHAASIFDLLALEQSLAARIESVVRVGDRRWDVRFVNGVTVRLPEADAGAAWRRLADLDRQQGILSRDIAALDMRLPDRLIVKLTPEAAEARSKRLDGRT